MGSDKPYVKRIVGEWEGGVVHATETKLKSTITETERLQLIGLMVLAKRHCERLDDIRDAVCAITGDDRDGHSADSVWADHDADALLEKLDIKVAG